MPSWRGVTRASAFPRPGPCRSGTTGRRRPADASGASSTAVHAATVAAVGRSAGVEAATAVAATTVEAPTATAAMETSSSAATSSVTAVLGKSGDGCANENEGSDTCQKSLQQGGFRHNRSLHRTAVLCPGGQPASANPTFNWTHIPSRKYAPLSRKSGSRHCLKTD